MVSNSADIQQLQTAIQELSVLNDIAIAVSSARELDQVVELIIQKCVKHLNVEQGAVMLLDEKKSDTPFQTMVRKVDSRVDVVPYHFGIQLSGWMLKHKKPLLINDFRDDNRFRLDSGTTFLIQSLLSVPLRLKGRLMGVLNVFNKRSEEGFTPTDLRLLSIIGTQSAQVIENARLYEEEQALLRIEEDLRVAHEIQSNLLPQENPQIPGYDIAGKSISAKEVGGDYYDFIPIDDQRLAICLGDVSGKGMPAALLMANLQATLRGQALFSTSTSDCLQRSNKLLYQSTDEQKFVTLFYGILNTQKNELWYSKAGHDPPYLFSNNEVRQLETGGTILGFLEETTFKEEVVPLNVGDTLAIYSDGITEAMNTSEEEFGKERLEKIIRENLNLSAKELIDIIIDATELFSSETAQADDITLVVIKRVHS